MGTPSTNERFVIGVDFGTTYSPPPPFRPGANLAVQLHVGSFHPFGKPRECITIIVQKWPNAANNSSAYRVPTEVLYTNPITRQKLWGYEASAGGRGSGRCSSGGCGGGGDSTDVLMLLQERPTRPILAHGSVPRSSSLESLFDALGLHGGSDAPGLSSTFVPPCVTPAQRTALKLQQINLAPVAVVADFLAAVRKTTLASIEGCYGTEWALSIRKEYVLTVPALWSDAAKSHGPGRPGRRFRRPPRRLQPHLGARSRRRLHPSR